MVHRPQRSGKNFFLRDLVFHPMKSIIFIFGETQFFFLVLDGLHLLMSKVRNICLARHHGIRCNPIGK